MKTIDYYTNEERAKAPARKEYTPIRRFYAIIGFSFLVLALGSLLVSLFTY
jgi:hypothetical protein